tara:strand:+ start:3259 stop:6687 length:3429 start_codon:yes stop_codon:yes gene_type:complete
MANTFLDNKISSFIEDKFPEFVRSDHPHFVEFLRLYYQFMEAAKVTMSSVQAQDNLLLENALTENFLLNEDGSKFYSEDSTYGAFIKGETVTGATSGATSTILAEDNTNSVIYIEQNRFFQVKEAIVGATSGARGTISKYQGNPVQNIQQLLEYVNIDKTISDFLDQFRDTYLTSIPNTLASGVSKRNLVKNIRDLYRAKGTKKGHELFFRLLFDETPEIFYPTDNLLKTSGGDWTSDTIIRIIATEGDPNNLVGQVITQTEDVGLNAEASTAIVESVLTTQEGETTVYQLLLNLETIDGTFVQGATVSGIDNTDADQAIQGTVQIIITGASVVEGASVYTTSDLVSVTSDIGEQAKIDIVDVGSGSVQEIIIDNPGSGYEVGQELYFDNTNTEGSGASAKITGIGGALAPESGTVAANSTMSATDHIVFEEATEQNDAYTGNLMMFETGTFATTFGQDENNPLSVAPYTDNDGHNIPTVWSDERTEVNNITTFSEGGGYEILPTVVVTTFRIYWNKNAITTTGTFRQEESVTTNTGLSGIVGILRDGNMSVANATGTFLSGNVITGSSSGAVATLTSVISHGTTGTFKAWATSGLGAVKGLEVSSFGTKYTTTPTLSLPTKILITRNVVSGSEVADVTLAGSFAVGDTVSGDTSGAEGTVTAWDNTRQLLTVNITNSTDFSISEKLTRGSVEGYATVSRVSKGILNASVGTVGITAGAYDSDKGKISESLMKIQDSYYYQDYSYVVRVGSAIADWRGSVKKAVHPAGFAVFGEVSISTQVATRITTPVTGISSETPELASLFEAVLHTIVGRRLGTSDDGTSIRSDSLAGHKMGIRVGIKGITRSSTTATVTTIDPHGIENGDFVQVSGVTTAGYDGAYEVSGVTNETFDITVVNTLTTPAVIGDLGKILLVSPFDTSTRDVTMSAHYDIPITVEILSGFDSLQKNRYGMGATKKTAAKYLWGAGGWGDTTPIKQTNLEYAYPNITRRQKPHTAEDNVDAGTAGVYNTTMKYTNIQVGVHEQNVHMTLEQFGDVRIDEIVRPERIVAESGTNEMDNFEDDRSYFITEDDTGYIESLNGFATTGDSQTIPIESNKLWNVPPPSYIRGISIASGEYVTFDDNTIPPDFSDNTAPPSFDGQSGT